MRHDKKHPMRTAIVGTPAIGVVAVADYVQAHASGLGATYVWR